MIRRDDDSDFVVTGSFNSLFEMLSRAGGIESRALHL